MAKTLLLSLFFLSLNLYAGLSTVNAKPQLSVERGHFGFYWAVWRDLSPTERLSLSSVGGSLISKRDIHWELASCETQSSLHQHGETFWFLDPLQWENGELIPVKEAQRPGYRYLNLITLSSRFLKGQGAYTPPKREKDESSQAYTLRKRIDFQNWKEATSLLGTYGTIRIKSEQRLLAELPQTLQSQFTQLENYGNLPTAQQSFLSKFNPMAWPVYYDERAHKLHTWKKPVIWEDSNSLHTDVLQLRLKWNGCEKEKGLAISGFMPEGGLPPPGPSRSGRPEAGNADFKIYYEEIN